MNTACEMFLLAVEEMNFTRAAKRAFVTQQCLSIHIKNLEQEHGIKLFERTPRMSLTKAGEALYHSLRQIQIAEKAMQDKLADIRDGTRGEIVFGINTTRARLILPSLYDLYHQQFPNVMISVVMDDMKNLVGKLLEGKIDLFLGVDCISDSNLKSMPLDKENALLLATEELLKQYAINQSVYETTLKTGIIDLHHFPGLPFAGNYAGSSFNNLVERYLNYYNIAPNINLFMSDYETQISLCSRHLLAVFCPQSILEIALRYNENSFATTQIKIMHLKDMQESLRIELITNRQSYQPYYLQEFINLFRSLYRESKTMLEKCVQI